ncbi:ABC transporter substrate-binding protein [Pelotomaculum isophthalicicum JI]|uniref:ABC transporter substrate-binding protein n=1 Tax=Pelotomaculum isophthalicicum JI TaxID=947010 RepID=A0A9X4JVM5_9FIRM|nr:ABC transporter substrate-binding protein [Pelotomaculum isophthalicicum]MDF9407693.1 ABC transporter substrate-binding protein [Pelotomaculum isophthalicicum JI]
MKLKIVVITVFMLLLANVTGCAGKNAVQTNTDKKIEKIVIAEPGTGESWLPVYLADKLGYFDEQGLNVDYSDFGGGHGPLVIASLIAGDSQFALTGYDQVLKTYGQGKSTKMIMATSDKNPWSLFVGKDIKSFADLKGKKISGGMEGSSPRAFVRACLKYGGLDPEKDVEYVTLPSSGSLIGALEKGEVAAGIGSGITKIQLLNLGYKPLVDLTDPQQHQKVLNSKDFPLYVVQVTDDFIKNHPDTVQKFSNAVVKAMHWENTHSPEEIAEKISPFFPNANKDDLISDIKDVQLTLSKDGYFSQEGHDTVTKSALDVGMIKEPVAMANVVDDSFLKKAHDSYAK